MAQVPMRMPQAGLVTPHQQRPSLMVPMTQPPPVTMQGLVSMAPMMGHGAGMAVMTQAMNHPDSGHDPHHNMTAPYHPHHHHHHHPPPHHHRHPPPQSHHPGHHPPGPPGPMQYHPHPHHGGHGPPPNVPINHGSHHGHMSRMTSHTNGPTINGQSHIGTSPSQGNQSQHSLPPPSSQQSLNQPMRQQFASRPMISPQPSVQASQSAGQNMTSGPDQSKTSGTITILSNGTDKLGGTSVVSTSVASSLTSTSPDANENNILAGSESSDSATNSDPLGTREKTPMCLINELARFNQIQHHYCLTEEKGPAHKKVFTVTLRLGDNEEEFTAAGRSIKKAQHSAAALALSSTKFKKPPPKPPKSVQQVKLTPTVELNALAMKRGELATYSFMENPRHQYPYNMPGTIRGVYPKRFYPALFPPFCVCLRMGGREFTGEGLTSQQAKHNAASKALRAFKIESPASEQQSKSSSATDSQNDGGDLVVLGPHSELKSPISLVHEIALKRNLNVVFEVLKESGPPHMRTFVHSCTVGEHRTTVEGSGKKASKKNAAEKMLEELKALPPLPVSSITAVKRKAPVKKKAPSNLIKEQKASPDYGQGINPISRLIQIQQAKKEREPAYSLVAERGVPRRREFVMQVVVGNQTAQGSGPNKKLAKRAAAESMLQLLGYSRPQPQPSKSAIKVENNNNETDKSRKQVTFVEQNGLGNSTLESLSRSQTIPAGSSGRQLVPGLIMMPENSSIRNGYQQNSVSGENINNLVNIQKTAAIAKELLETGNSNTAKVINNPTVTEQNQAPQPSLGVPQIAHQPPCMQASKPSQAVSSSSSTSNRTAVSSNTSGQAVRPKDQLMYLANILNLQVQFTDFPKGNKSEYLSLVSLSTTPPHVSHGAGTSLDASHDQASLTALRALAEMGLDSVSGNSDSA